MIIVGTHICFPQVWFEGISMLMHDKSITLVIQEALVRWIIFVLLNSDPATCVFASTTRDHPIHLWDAFSGEVCNAPIFFVHGTQLTYGS
jgi:WD40 repeat protein